MITTPKFEVCIEYLRVHVFDLNGLNQSEIFNLSIKDITKYVYQELYPLAGKELWDVKVPIISNPKKPDLAQGQSTMENIDKAMLQEDKKEYTKEKRIYKISLISYTGYCGSRKVIENM